MKKYLPVILPIVALLLVAYIGVRWYRSRTSEELTPPEVTAGTEIEDLSSSQAALLENLRRGLGNFQTVKLDATTQEALGEIRYEISDGMALFSVNANLPSDNGEVYHLWYQATDSETFRDGGTLELNKGGLIAAANVNVDQLPVTVEIRRGSEVVLTGIIPAPESVN